MVPYNSTGEEVSDLKVRTMLHISIIDAGGKGLRSVKCIAPPERARKS